jgi:SWIM zinc finger
MLNLNQETLNAVVEQACINAAAYGRWLVAIGRAAYELEANPWIERNDHGGLDIASPSGSVYAANGTCGCKAFEFGQPCWHRAAARIVRLHDEREAAADQLADKVIAVVEQTQATRKIAAARCAAQFNAELFA